MLRPLAWLAISASVLWFGAAPSRGATTTPEQARTVVREALAEKGSVEARTEELLNLAWLRDGVPAAISEQARQQLALYGATVIPAMRRALGRVRVDQTEAVVRTILEARETQHVGIPNDFVPALVDALWVGSPEAKRLAIPVVARTAERFALLPLLDSAIEDPSLAPEVIRALGVLGDDRARFFLEKALHEGGPGNREAAAVALARIGGRALSPLRDATRSEDREVRLAAVRALLPVASPEDLTPLYVFLSRHEADDPATTQAVRAAAEVLEARLEAQRAADAASASPDF